LLPWNFVQVWKGGLSFHGGLAGVTAAIILFSWHKKVPWLRVGDACALAVTPGILAVRCANFINGELFGRVTKPGVGWAMQFPTDPRALGEFGIGDQRNIDGKLVNEGPSLGMRDRELCIQVAFGHRSWESVQGKLSTTDENHHPVAWSNIKDRLDWQKVRTAREQGELLVPYRHPSQL